MTFEEWRQRFEKNLIVGKPAWNAFRAWCEQLKEFQQSAKTLSPELRRNLPKGHPWTTDPEEYVLKSIYQQTYPASEEEVRRQREQRKHSDSALSSPGCK
jgi:hypothetical protein